ncbi:hypothetical protein E3N88_44466 [Mikania micrantha]|uniref:Senescence-associated protein n=1 Tax=Mikania micrantha TaxID=192012 RepID=A0A5N6LC63_9ASTR|nr:hypothetical protein E3N88_44466 [Mikania micrantha]
MIGRADIEGSKSNVTMNAWLPQASYPCGNFSDTSSFKFRRSKGSLGTLSRCAAPAKLPPDNVFRPDRPTEAGLGSSFPADSAKPVPLAVFCWIVDRGHRIPLVRTSSELAVRRPGKAPEDAVPGTPVPSPQSQSFSRGYGSILPTSLAYIVPLTRGCSPWRPDAVMSTTRHGRHSVLRIFKGRQGRTEHRATCGALPAARPYLRLSRFQGGQAVKQKR